MAVKWDVPPTAQQAGYVVRAEHSGSLGGAGGGRHTVGGCVSTSSLRDRIFGNGSKAMDQKQLGSAASVVAGAAPPGVRVN